jgi:hypothetical protein
MLVQLYSINLCDRVVQEAIDLDGLGLWAELSRSKYGATTDVEKYGSLNLQVGIPPHLPVHGIHEEICHVG